ncbi:conserved hypothetical protein [Burkholderia sp. 8Y]|uniref:hypothetical protein n=1 Tax=Burkholderia sp. 8Y TaxID=2653133 RepID=UPI0012F11337|nr:hypothetical protein [Burkholderia sp. 8Y]VXB23539.1 conserved hypothetical protein [Burkholderia sp. 8Y]
MIRHHPAYRALLDSLDALGKAQTATTPLIHRASVSFVEAMAYVTGERCSVMIGQTVIAREHERENQRSNQGAIS